MVLVLGRGGRTLAGTIRMPDGHPAVGAQVVANREENGRSWKPFGHHAEHRATADNQGNWRIDDVEDGSFALWAMFRGCPTPRPRASHRDAAVALAFDPPSRVTGVVVGSDGRPVSDFLIAVLPLRLDNETPAARERRSQASQLLRSACRPATAPSDSRGCMPGPTR